MPIDFFQDSCKSSSEKTLFGISDDALHEPAYIDENDNSKWIAIVANPNQKELVFFAIDNCVEILRPNGELESRCDGLLKDQENLIFIELKERQSSGWLGDGIRQLKTTLNIFKENYDTSNCDSIEAYVCNSLRPRSSPARATAIQEFYDSTEGCILRVQQEISI